MQSFGSGAMSNSFGEIQSSDCIFIIGSNTTANQPVAAAFMKQAIKKGTKLIVCDPRRNQMGDMADIYMQNYSGTNIAIVNGMISHIITNKLYDKEFIGERTEGFEALEEIAEKFTPEVCSIITGVPAEYIKKSAEMYAKGPRSAVYWGMGVAQHANGVDCVNALANLVMICGMIGKEGTGANPLRGQNNVQGSGDTSTLPNQLPGYQLYTEENLNKFEEIWGVRPPNNQGFKMTEMLLPKNEMKALYIIGGNPAHSNADLPATHQALRNLDFLVVQDIFMTTTAEFADVVLPATAIPEKYGTTTNSERRIQMNRPAVIPPGLAKPDIEIFLEIIDRLGYKQEGVTDRTNMFTSSEEIMAEISRLTPQYAGVTYEKINRHNEVHWPIKADEDKGAKFLHKTSFPVGKGKIKPIEYSPADEQTDAEYSVILTTGRTLYHWHGMTLTEKSPKIMNIEARSFIEINPDDAEKWGISENDAVRVVSRRGSVISLARVVDTIKPNVVFVPFHFKDAMINLVTNPILDPLTKEPEFKVCAVKIEKVQVTDPDYAKYSEHNDTLVSNI